MVFSKSSERLCWVCSLRSRKHFLLAGTDKLGIFAGGGASSSLQLKTVVVDSSQCLSLFRYKLSWRVRAFFNLSLSLILNLDVTLDIRVLMSGILLSVVLI